MERKQQVIRELGLFSGCSRDEVSWIAKHADELVVPAGTRIATVGRYAHEFCVVLDGFAEASGTGAPVTLGPGSYFGHVEITSDRPHAMDVITKGDVRLLVFEVRAFRGFAECVPSAIRKLFGEVATRVPVGPAVGRRLAVAS